MGIDYFFYFLLIIFIFCILASINWSGGKKKTSNTDLFEDYGLGQDFLNDRKASCFPFCWEPPDKNGGNGKNGPNGKNDKSNYKIELSFLATGDIGGTDEPPFQDDFGMNVAKSMDRISQQDGTNFILLLGNNFYDTGVKKRNRPKI